jgi:hypothetical protein
MKSGKKISVAVLFLLAAGLRPESTQLHAQSNAATPQLTVHVLDEHGGSIPGAAVTMRDAAGHEFTATTDGTGLFRFPNITPGQASVRVSAPSFAATEQSGIKVGAGDNRVEVTLKIETKKESVLVVSGNPFFKGAAFGGSSVILTGAALEALPLGPGGLEAALRALAVRTAGPFGPQFLVDGFEGNPVPLTNSIREIRINDNPFSAEYSKLGLGRVEILTKPGSDEFHGQVFFNFSDAVLNSRNPFASNRAPYQSRLYGANFGGPIVRKRATFFIDFARQDSRSNAVINATVVDPAFQITPLTQAVVTPYYSNSIAPRLDFQLSPANTLVVRYSYKDSRTPNSGVGLFALPSQSLDLTTKSHTIQLTETSVLNAKTINETRFQLVRDTTAQSGNNSTPVINVPGAFTGGGANIGVAFDKQNQWQLQNLTTRQSGPHVLKAGVELRSTTLNSTTDQNFGGTYVFNGGLAPQLDAQNQVVSGAPLISISSIEAYRRTLLFSSLGYSPQEIRALGGGASQFSMTAGNVFTPVRIYQVAAFLQGDWHLGPRFTLDGGIRFEHQTGIPGDFDFGPRLGFAWGLDGDKSQPKTVLRGGVGLFYDRVGERLVLRSLQLNGVHQQQFITSDPAVLDLFPSVPTPTQIAAFSVPQSIVRLAPGIRAPYTIHSSLSLERQLPGGLSLALTYARIRGVHLLRSRDANAPLPGSLTRPDPNLSGIFDYESTGVFNQDQLLANVVYVVNKKITLWTTYTFSNARTDTDGADTFPANGYNLRQDYGRSGLIPRHSLYWGGWISAPGKVELIPLALWRSGLPFDITTGRDNNGDSLFTDRPAFANGLTGPDVVATPYGTFNLNPSPYAAVIPRNYGMGPGFLIVNLQLRRKFPITEHLAITLAAQGVNILNHTNPGVPIGSLASPQFGLSNTAAGDWGLGSNQAGNRRLDFSIFLDF